MIWISVWKNSFIPVAGTRRSKCCVRAQIWYWLGAENGIECCFFYLSLLLAANSREIILLIHFYWFWWNSNGGLKNQQHYISINSMTHLFFHISICRLPVDWWCDAVGYYVMRSRKSTRLCSLLLTNIVNVWTWHAEFIHITHNHAVVV